MQLLVFVMMMLVCFSFILKQTFHNVKEIVAIAVIIALFMALTWPWAIEQSKAQIDLWIANRKLMLNMAVVLTADVALTVLFCIYHVDVNTSAYVSKHKRLVLCMLKYFPGILIFPVLFSVLVATLSQLPGLSFQMVAYVLAGIALVLTIVLPYGLRRLLPEPSIRLELLFLVEVLLALMGIIATVNGKTTMIIIK